MHRPGYYRDYYRKNRERIRRRRAEWYERTAEVRREHDREYRNSHREIIRAKLRRYRQTPAFNLQDAAAQRAKRALASALHAQDAELFAAYRANERSRYAKRRVKNGKVYSPRFHRRIPDWATKGMKVLDTQSAYLAVNNTDAHRYFAMMLAVERKAQRRAYV